MTATLTIDAKRQLVLPKRICQQARLRPGTRVRISSANEGLLLSPVEPSSEEELRALECESGRPLGKQPKNAMEIVKRAITKAQRGG
jgi:bifunctional DNA-binding transcriptional regulator/antitoxin component of YhaV-PrlF toxin-antitoxin module